MHFEIERDLQKKLLNTHAQSNWYSLSMWFLQVVPLQISQRLHMQLQRALVSHKKAGRPMVQPQFYPIPARIPHRYLPHTFSPTTPV